MTSTAPLAYLILAHHQPEHLRRLIRALASPRAFFFVHVDGKASLEAFRGLASERSVTLLSERVDVHWGGYSQVAATRRLLDVARAADPGFCRYTLLSGADFPVRSRDEIERTLGNSDREYVRVDRKLSGSERNEHSASVERIHLNDSAWFNRKLPTPHPLLRFFTANTLAVGSRLLPRRRYVANLTPYHGAQWWSLTAACVRHVLTFLDHNPSYERFHRTVRVPDEIFFHSVIKASPFAAKISQDFEAGSAFGNVHGVHYIDWHARGVSLPKVLDESDLPMLRESGALFARKFDARRSEKLLALLEADQSA